MLKRVCRNYSRAALIAEIEKHDIISFDIFDTLVMRNVYYNKDVFRIMAQELDPVWNIDFFEIRTEAERVLSQETYPYIEEIYAYISDRYPCLKGHEQALIDREIELETELILPRHDVVEMFYLAQKLQKQVYIVSDMYMHHDTLAAILEKNGIHGYKKLLVSSEYRSSKPQHLFEHYLKEIPEGTFLHIGDSWACDIIPSGKLGIDSFRLKMSTEIYEYQENTIPPQDLQTRTQVAEYVAKHYNSPFS
jgi:predicted HAD superfamily hydrolase